jgi:hypothetical protein
MTWQGNSTDAANIAVRNRYAVRLDAVRAITVSSTFSGPTTSSSKLRGRCRTLISGSTGEARPAAT